MKNLIFKYPYNHSKFKIMHFKGDKLYKTYKGYNTKNNALKYFNNLFEGKPEVIFKKEHIKTGGEIKKRTDWIGLVKMWEDESDNGYPIVYTNLDYKYVLIKERDWFVEESFNLFDNDKNNLKVDLKTLESKIFRYLNNSDTTLQFIIINNKILFYDFNYINLIRCKCIEDAERLYEVLYNSIISQYSSKCFFVGRPADRSMSEFYYELIMDHTGWNKVKVWRTSLRP